MNKLDFCSYNRVHELDCFDGGKLSELLLVKLSCLLEDLRKFYE